MPASAATDRHTYRPSCGLSGGALCHDPAPCIEVGSDGETYEGLLYDAVAPNGTVDFQVCVSDAPGEPDAPPVVTPGMVLRAFQRLSWPASDLEIQPPKGRTAVNWETYFLTRDTAAVTQQVTLLGQRITIEATPSQFTWHYGDGESETTSSPGGPYPSGDVIHLYRAKDVLSPHLETTYTGRYRVNNGPWVTIPGSHAVAGTPQRLEVIEVRPTLVTPYAT